MKTTNSTIHKQMTIIYRNRVAHHFFNAMASRTSKKLDWAWWQKYNITIMSTSWQCPSWYVKKFWLTNTKNSIFCKQMTMSFLRTEPQISCSSHEQPWSLISMSTMSTTKPDGWLIIFLYSNVNIQLFLMCNTPLWPSYQGSCVHVDYFAFLASKCSDLNDKILMIQNIW